MSNLVICIIVFVVILVSLFIINDVFGMNDVNYVLFCVGLAFGIYIIVIGRGIVCRINK